MPEVANYILATAGHVDHGKSALVCALTGIDPDRLPEEKSRGITIDLGFAHLDLSATGAREGDAPAEPAQQSAPTSRDLRYASTLSTQHLARIGIIDVPGHQDFVKNMVAGVGSIDLALLVVAADDGWMPQTEEHLQILGYLGVRHGVVALTKVDLFASHDQIIQNVRNRLAGTCLESAAIVKTSIVDGRGINELKEALARELSKLPPQPDIGKPRLPVDRAFTFHGIGTVITGTLTGGTLHQGQSVIVQPDGHSARIRSIHSYNRPVEQALPGSRVALNLPDLRCNETVKRGDVVMLADSANPHYTIDVLLEISSRRASSLLRSGSLVHFHHGTLCIGTSVHLPNQQELTSGGRAFAQLRLKEPIVTFIGDRFILRDWPQRQTLAGGIVLDPHASKRGFQTPVRLNWLDRQLQSLDSLPDVLASQMHRERCARSSTVLRQSRFSRQQIAQATRQLADRGNLIVMDNLIADASCWQEICAKALDRIGEFHRTHPESPGLQLGEVRRMLSGDHLELSVAERLIEQLCFHECVRDGTTIRLRSHSPALPSSLAPAAAKICEVLLSAALTPPARNELAPDGPSQQTLGFLLHGGQAIELDRQIVLHADCYARTVEAIRKYLSENGPSTASELKKALNTSRRVIIPLLEKLVRDGITRRNGERHALKENPARSF